MKKEKWLFENIMLIYNELGKDYQVDLEDLAFKSIDNYFEVWLKPDKKLIMIFKIEINYSYISEPEYKFTLQRCIKTLDVNKLDFACDFIKHIVREVKLNKILK